MGRRALRPSRPPGGPARRLVGLQLDWYDIEALFDAQGLPPAISPTVDRSPVPVFADGRQVGKATSHGWSPILKQALALASVPPRYERIGHAAPGGVDRRGPARPRRRDGRRAAVPRPRAQARMSTAERPARAGGPADGHRLRGASTASSQERLPRVDGRSWSSYLAIPSEGGDMAAPARRGRLDGRRLSAAGARRSRCSSSTASRRSSSARSATVRAR